MQNSSSGSTRKHMHIHAQVNTSWGCKSKKTVAYMSEQLFQGRIETIKHAETCSNKHVYHECTRTPTYNLYNSAVCVICSLHHPIIVRRTKTLPVTTLTCVQFVHICTIDRFGIQRVSIDAAAPPWRRRGDWRLSDRELEYRRRIKNCSMNIIFNFSSGESSIDTLN